MTRTEVARFDHEARINSGAFSPDGALVVTSGDDRAARLWNVASGTEVARLHHLGRVRSAAFNPAGSQVVTVSYDERIARIWDVTWLAKFTGERLARAVAREHLKGATRLTEEQLRILPPMLADVRPDVTSRWLTPSPDDTEIEAILSQWRRHREVALGLARRDWAARAERVRAEFAARRNSAGGQSTSEKAAAAVSAATTADAGLSLAGRRWFLLALFAVMTMFALAAARGIGPWP